MNRQQYRVTRRLLRDNGRYALCWMSLQQLRVWEHLLDIQAQRDYMQDRVNIIRYCQVNRIPCNVRHTGAY